MTPARKKELATVALELLQGDELGSLDRINAYPLPELRERVERRIGQLVRAHEILRELEKA